jgi:tetrahydromethanopterin S-methyltransferase subunit G
MDERFNEVDKRLNKVDEHFNEVGERFKEVGGRFNETDEKFIGIYARLDRGFSEVNERLDRIEYSQPEDIVAVLKQIDKNTSYLKRDL